MIVVPAIIPTSKEHLFATLAPLRGVAKDIQIDLVDGIYAGTPSWPLSAHDSFQEMCAAITELSHDFSIEVDLMVEEPEHYVDQLIEAGASRLVIHIGSTKKLDSIVMHRNRVKIGFAFQNKTLLEMLERFAYSIDFVQCMGIAEIGAQGNGFDDRVLPRIKDIHTRYPSLEISVDGHVTMFTLSLLKDAGATRFISGSAIFSAEDPKQAFLQMQKLAEA